MVRQSRRTSTVQSAGSGTGSPSRADVAERLHAAAVQLLRSLRREDDRAAVPPAQMSALARLIAGGPLSLAELAAVQQVTAPTMSQVIKRLEQRGLVTRHADPADRRAILLRATARGRTMLKRGKRSRIGRLVDMLKPLRAREVRVLSDAADLIESMAELNRAGEA